MKIINIDAPKKLVELFFAAGYHIPDFIQSVLGKVERDYYDNFNVFQDITKRHPSHSPVRKLLPVWKFECGRYENIAVLWHTIPIYLRDKKPKIDERKFNNNFKCIVDPLGAYISYFGNDTPHIELYLTDIYETIRQDIIRRHPTLHFTLREDREPVYFKNLVTIVLLHELAHAALDIFNLEDAPLSEMVSYDDAFGKWREESMANAVALKIINKLNEHKPLKDYAKKFMELQPAEYALGVKMVDFESSDFDSVFNAKLYGVDENLQQKWLDYAQGTPDWSGLKKWNADINGTFPTKE